MGNKKLKTLENYQPPKKKLYKFADELLFSAGQN